MNKKQKSLTNKGFSLVELIIVIAIMAVLVGVLAPQFLKYVERSRKSTDVQNVASIVTALQTYAADPMVADGDKLEASGVITLSTSATAVDTSNCTGKTDKALTAAGINSIGLKSSEWTTGGTVKLAVTYANGVVSIEVDTTTPMKNTNTDILTGKYE